MDSKTQGILEDGVVYLFGGFDGINYYDNILYSDFSEGAYSTWEEATAVFASPRSRMRSVFISPFIYITGYYDGSSYSSTCYRCMPDIVTHDILVIGEIPSVAGTAASVINVANYENFLYALSCSGSHSSLYGIDSRYVIDFATFDNPQGVSRRNNYVYVADTGNSQIDKLRHSDTSLSSVHYVRTYIGSGSTSLLSPEDVDADDLYVYVADTGNNRVVSCSRTIYIM